ARLVVADGDIARHRDALFHAPEHEYAGRRGGHVVEIALGLGALQHDRVAGVQPLRRRGRIDDDARLVGAFVIAEDAKGFPRLALPWVVDGAPLHDYGHARSGLFHRASDARPAPPFPRLTSKKLD